MILEPPIDAETEKVLASLVEFERIQQSEAPNIQREVLSRFIERVTLYFEEKNQGERVVTAFAQGNAVIKPVALVMPSVGAGNRI